MEQRNIYSQPHDEALDNGPCSGNWSDVQSTDQVLWSLSTVSHGHNDGVIALAEDLRLIMGDVPYQLIVTINDGNVDHRILELSKHAYVKLIVNKVKRGFGANHNYALKSATGNWVAIIDAELRMRLDPFSTIMQCFNTYESVGLIAPTVFDENGYIEDNARKLVTPFTLLRRHILLRKHASRSLLKTREVDWVAGLFMSMPRDLFNSLGGFDERYFLYCEDVDLSLRVWLRGYKVLQVPMSGVCHQARRASRSEQTHFGWHLQSLLRLWTSRAFYSFLLFLRRERKN